MWSLSDRGLYWVRTTTLSISELTQFDRVKSMIRYLPPNGTAGFARTDDRIESRSPSPPARITAITGFTKRRPSGRAASAADASTGGRCRSGIRLAGRPAPAAQVNSRGFTKLPLNSTIQWRWAPVEWPVLPS